MSQEVLLLDLKAQFSIISVEIRNAIDEVIESQAFILGPKVEALENEIAAYCRVDHAIGVSSGTDALLASLMALDIGPGDEVITSSFSFFATAGVIARLRAKPIFIDIEPKTFNVDPGNIKRAVTEKTKAIIPVHLFGQSADMAPILEVARKFGIPVIEDAAQSIGSEYRGKKAGALGTMGTFSFFPSKNLGCFGDGGMIVTNDSILAEKLKALRHHGAIRPYDHKIVGGNFRLDALQAAVLSVKLKYLDQWAAARRDNAKYYDQRFMNSGLISDGSIRTPPAVYAGSGDENYHIYNQYALRVKNRDDLKAHLERAGVGTAIYYPKPLHLQDCFADLGYAPGCFPEAERACKEVLSIPIYPELRAEQKEYVVDTILSFYRKPGVQ